MLVRGGTQVMGKLWRRSHGALGQRWTLSLAFCRAMVARGQVA